MLGHTPSEHFWLKITDYSEERSISMFAEMTRGSNHTLLFSRKEIERNCCTLYRQQIPRSEKICPVSRSRTKDQKHPKSLRTCLKFCFKESREKMEHRDLQMDSLTEGAEGRFRELTSKWFIETQLPLIIHNGFFPSWFLGFITRKYAEELLTEKEVGCFLVRLSDKAIGYILSYKGRDRCRHFVINQSETGQFIVCGDTKGHGTVPELIEYYKTNPIEPFGEYLTSVCFETLNEELYDIIQVSPKEKPVAAVRAVKNAQQQHTKSAVGKTPAWPTKTLEEVPPLPRRNKHFESGLLNDQDGVVYAQLSKQSPREIPRSQNICQYSLPGKNLKKAQRPTTQLQNQISRCSPLSGPDSDYSELSLLENSKSRSLPLLDITSNEERYRLSAPPHISPRFSPEPNRQAASYVQQSENTDQCSMERSTHSLEYMGDDAVYHLAGRPGCSHTTSSETRSMTSRQHSDSVYAEVSNEAPFAQDNTYELIPGHTDTDHPKPNNTYEPLEDVRHKPVKNDNGKWKWLFPDTRRKW